MYGYEPNIDVEEGCRWRSGARRRQGAIITYPKDSPQTSSFCLRSSTAATSSSPVAHGSCTQPTCAWASSTKTEHPKLTRWTTGSPPYRYSSSQAQVNDKFIIQTTISEPITLCSSRKKVAPVRRPQGTRALHAAQRRDPPEEGRTRSSTGRSRRCRRCRSRRSSRNCLHGIFMDKVPDPRVEHRINGWGDVVRAELERSAWSRRLLLGRTDQLVGGPGQATRAPGAGRAASTA